jgi:hypothetical protein
VLLAEKRGWDTAARAAVKRGTNDIEPWLEFTVPQRAGKYPLSNTLALASRKFSRRRTIL